jgi:hypothetical protein
MNYDTGYGSDLVDSIQAEATIESNTVGGYGLGAMSPELYKDRAHRAVYNVQQGLRRASETVDKITSKVSSDKIQQDMRLWKELQVENAATPPVDTNIMVTGSGGGDSPWTTVGSQGATIQPLMASRESGAQGYDAIWGAARADSAFATIKPTEMTVREVLAFQQERGEGSYAAFVKATNNDVLSTPVGAYQYVGTTLAEEVKRQGIDMDAKFSPELQNQIFYTHAARLLRGQSTQSGKFAVLKRKWDGLNSPGVTHSDMQDLVTSIEQYLPGPPVQRRPEQGTTPAFSTTSAASVALTMGEISIGDIIIIDGRRHTVEE